jgi:preprotein translocase subunit YajC
MFPFLMMIAIFYFFLIRPQQKQKKEHQNLINNLKVNDKVVTSSGIIGKIMAIKDDKNIVILRVDEATNTKIEFQKHTVVGVIEKEENNA